MITTCTECQARYQLEDENIPARVIRVRCPACRGVFSLDGTAAAQTPVAAPAAVVRPVADLVQAARPVAPPVSKPAAPVAEAKPDEPRTSVAVLDAPAEAAPVQVGGKRRRRPKEEMLARALVSDIKVYNRELYEAARQDGNLLEALGTEIKKSWELYKEKVTPEVANGTDHFRRALNDILADGDKVF